MKRKVMKVMSAAVIVGLLMFNVATILADASGGGTDPSCKSGGPGSTSCTLNVSGGIAGSGGAFSCSVTCGTGYYACCSLVSLNCRCKPNSGGVTGGTSS
jgi:hypothetical protein